MPKQVSTYAFNLYDAIMLYAHAADALLRNASAGGLADPHLLVRAMMNTSFATPGGIVELDGRGDMPEPVAIMNYKRVRADSPELHSIKLGVHEPHRRVFVLTPQSGDVVWPGGLRSVPKGLIAPLVTKGAPVQRTMSEAYVLAALLIVVIAAMLFVGLVYRKRQKQAALEKTQQELQEIFLNVLDELSAQDDSAVSPPEVDPTTTEITFVMTDIEKSTDASVASPDAMQEVQIVHDLVMREAIAKFNGFEIATQGDAFEIAFVSTVDACNFANFVQAQLHAVQWSKAVLKLPQFGVAYAEDNRAHRRKEMLRGPRIRIGVHRAVAGTWSTFEHEVTRQVVFTGPSYTIAAAIADSANGGQILISGPTADVVMLQMPAMKFPVLRGVGCFKLSAPSLPPGQMLVELYDLQRYESATMPKRTFKDPPRNLLMLRRADGLSAVSLSQFSEASLTFVAIELVMEAPPNGRKSAIPRLESALSGSSAESAQSSKPRHGIDGLRYILARRLGICAAQSGGYLVPEAEHRNQSVAVFNDVKAAICFAAAGQMALLTTSYSQEQLAYCEPEQRAPDGRLIFRGVRSKMVIHTSDQYYSTTDSSPVTTHIFTPKGRSRHAVTDAEELDELAHRVLGQAHDQPRVFKGEAITYAMDVLSATYPGQILMTQNAWQGLHGKTPVGTFLLHAGALRQPVDAFGGSPPDPSPARGSGELSEWTAPLSAASRGQLDILMELVPNYLGARYFPSSLHSASTLEIHCEGYRSAPPISRPIAIAFCSLQSADGAVKELAYKVACYEIRRTLELCSGYSANRFWLCIAFASHFHSAFIPNLCRYECKEAEPGKFTLAFTCFSNAVRFAASVHVNLVAADWPPQLLALDECAPQLSSDGSLLFRGLRIKVGIAFGQAASRKPLKSGRAGLHSGHFEKKIFCFLQPPCDGCNSPLCDRGWDVRNPGRCSDLQIILVHCRISPHGL